MNLVPAAVVIITNDKGEILLMYRNSEPFGWCLPGGKLDYLDKSKIATESPDIAAKREVKEETNLDIEKLTYLGSDASINGRRVYIFKALKYSGELRINPREHKDYEWVSNVDSKNLAGRTKNFIEHYI